MTFWCAISMAQPILDSDYQFLKDYVEGLGEAVQLTTCLSNLDLGKPPRLDSLEKISSCRHCYAQGVNHMLVASKLMSKHTGSDEAVIKEVAERLSFRYKLLSDIASEAEQVYAKIQDVWMNPRNSTINLNQCQRDLAKVENDRILNNMLILSHCYLLEDNKSGGREVLAVTPEEKTELRNRLKEVFGEEVISLNNSSTTAFVRCANLLYQKLLAQE